jgi:hypothetical protein
MNFPPIKIINDRSSELAQNTAMGIRIATGTRYFAAVLLQEHYECIRYMAWFWTYPLLIATGAIIAHYFGYVIPINLSLGLAASALAIMMAVARGLLPFNKDASELMGQAVEIAAIEHFYQRGDMTTEYRLQARSMIRMDSSYSQRGYWPDIEKIDPAVFTNADVIAGTLNASIDAMVALLETKRGNAKSYVDANLKRLTKWRPLGEESKGY